MRYLTVQEVLFIHFQVIERFGGTHGVLNMAGLESAVARPKATMDGNDLYTNLLEKAAGLLQSLVINHPFQDGNKRTAFTALGLFLRFNDAAIESSAMHAEQFVIDVADKHLTVKTIANWLQSHTCSMGDDHR